MVDTSAHNSTLGTRERHLESLLQQSLRQIIFVKNFPRCLIQIVLQITSMPENEYVNSKLIQASSVRDLKPFYLFCCLQKGFVYTHCQGGADYALQNLPIIPALLQTAVLALLSGAMPLRATATSAFAAVLPADGGKKQVVVDPSPQQVDSSLSTHVLAFTSHDELLLAESEGSFTMQDWEDVYETARSICCELDKKAGVDMVLDEGQQNGPDMRHFLRSTLEARSAADLHWR